MSAWRLGDRAEPREWLETYLALITGPAEIGPACVLWPYALTSKSGYASINYGGRLLRVSHIVLEATGHPRLEPPNHHALHYCDTPACVHPRHLNWGSHRQNMLDVVLHGNHYRPGLASVHR